MFRKGTNRFRYFHAKTGLCIGLFFSVTLVLFCETAFANPLATPALTRGCLDSLGNKLADSLLDAALTQSHRSQYAAALKILNTPPLSEYSIADYFRGLVLLQSEEDEGDTAALTQAIHLWSAIWENPNTPAPTPNLSRTPQKQHTLVRALAGLQWAGAAQIQGKTWLSAKLSLQANEALKPLKGCPEADAGLALFDYYRATLLPNLFFIGGGEKDASVRLEKAADATHRLGSFFRTGWIWTRYDQKEYSQGLKAIDRYLKQYPESRLYLQMRGDFLFRSGEKTLALQAYRKVFAMYSALPKSPGHLPLGYLSCAGNLARIHASLENQDSAVVYLDIWEDPGYHMMQSWLPASLIKALKPLRKRLLRK